MEVDTNLIHCESSTTISPGVTIVWRARFLGRIEMSPEMSTPPSDSSEELSAYGVAAGGERIVMAISVPNFVYPGLYFLLGESIGIILCKMIRKRRNPAHILKRKL
jgi:hypothetical protein